MRAAALLSPLDELDGSAIAGLGLAQLSEHMVRTAVADGRLSRVLQAHAPPASSIHACYWSDADLGMRRIVDALRR